MVSRKSRRKFFVDLTELAKATESNPAAYAQLLRYNELIRAGKRAAITYDQGSGYRVFDPDEVRRPPE